MLTTLTDSFDLAQGKVTGNAEKTETDTHASLNNTVMPPFCLPLQLVLSWKGEWIR